MAWLLALSVWSQPVLQLIGGEFDVAKDLAQQSGADVAALVDGNSGPAPVRVLELPMASPRLSQQTKSHPFQGADPLGRLEDRQIGGAHTETSTRRTPM